MSEAFDKAIKHSINLGYGNLWYYDSAEYDRLLAAFNEALARINLLEYNLDNDLSDDFLRLAAIGCSRTAENEGEAAPTLWNYRNDRAEKAESDLAAAREEIKKLSSRIDSLLPSETEAVEQLARMRGKV